MLRGILLYAQSHGGEDTVYCYCMDFANAKDIGVRELEIKSGPRLVINPSNYRVHRWHKLFKATLESINATGDHIQQGHTARLQAVTKGAICHTIS